jgi:uncharacterized delta-60 repeat protein
VIRTQNLFRIFLILVVFLILVSKPAIRSEAATNSRPEIWSAVYNGPDNMKDVSKAMVVDDEGNVYVTGASEGSGLNVWDIVTIKYNSIGTPLWTKVYNGTGNSTGSNWDEGRDIAVDEQGYVYVTGTSISITEDDYITLRYTPDGELDWEQRYNGPGIGAGNYDQAYKLALDENYVYVAGISISEVGQWEFAVVIYSLQGNYIRELRHSGYTLSDMLVDEAGNIYIAGSTDYQESTQFDFLTIKYDPDGTLVWAYTYDSSENNDDTATDLFVDGNGNVYVTGDTEHIKDNMSYTYLATVKYSPGGTQLWAKRYTGVNNEDEGANGTGIAVNSAGYVYVIGSVYEYEEGWNYGVLKYDPDGNILWERSYDGVNNDIPYAIKLDDSGNVYVAGDSGTLKYDAAGNMLWLYQYTEEMTAYDMELDDAGNIYISGTCLWNFLTVKYPPNPPLFVSVYDGEGYEGSYSDDQAGVEFTITLSEAASYDLAVTYHTVDGTAIAGDDYVATSGNLTLQAGWKDGTIQVPIQKDTLQDEGNQYFYVSLDTVANARLTRNQARGTIWEDDINLQHWVARYPFTGFYQDVVDLALDSSGNSYVLILNYLENTLFSVLVKYNQNGGYVWEKSFTGQAYDALLVDDSFVYITGADSNENAILIKYSLNGEKLWKYTYDSSIHDEDQFNAIALDPWGNILIAGTSVLGHHAKARYPDFLVQKLTPDGNLAWTRTYGGTTGTIARGIGIDYLGNIYITGESDVGEYGNAIKILKYTSDGILSGDVSYIYQNNIFGTNTIEDTAVDPGGNVYIDANVVHEEHLWGVALKFTPAGSLAWEISCPTGCGAISNQAKALIVDSYGNVFIAGSADNDFGVTSYTAEGYYRWGDGIANGGYGMDITMDNKSNIYVTGTFSHDIWGMDYFTRVYNPSGDRIWEQTYSGQNSTDDGYKILVDEDGEMYVAGKSGGDIATINYGAVPHPLLINILDGYTREAMSGTTQAKLEVQLSEPQNADITFNYSTIEGTATAGQDYLHASGTVTIPENSTSTTFTVSILGDTDKEQDEFFYINLSNPSEGSFPNGQVRCMIWDSSYILQFLPVTVR